MGQETHSSSPKRLSISGATTTAEPGTIETVTDKTKADLARPWNVVVQNDPINLMSYVTMVFQKVFGYPRQKAEMLMMEVHTRGRSIVWTGGREPAEHYVRVLQQYNLWAIMEQAEL